MGVVMVKVAGVGRHVAYLEQTDQHKLEEEFVVLFPVQLIYISSFTFPKLSILFFYRRIFPTTQTRYTTFGLLGVVGATWLALTITVIFQCMPVAFSWDKTIQGGHCVNQDALYAYWSVPNIITDLIILFLPIPEVWNLHIGKLQKTGLIFTFLLGSLGLIACIVRFSIFLKNAALTDATWTSVPLQVWTITEPSMYFIAGILPTLRPVALFVTSKVKSYIGSSTGMPFSASSSRQISRTGGMKARAGSTTESRDLVLEPSGQAWEMLESEELATKGSTDQSPAEVREPVDGIRRTREVMITDEPA